ncbi:MAG: DNA polymerase III subunit gamma/tau [Deltaproteobacteria bacterium]|nr:MAG: DNA polymerase III subunit gamma/tau [Deltaproteobacteria bacterium]
MSQRSKKVLALRYRPKSFDELIGQRSVTQTLSLALDINKLSHAYLFSGLRGSGKTSTARIFARALICENRKNHNPCNECDNCKASIDGRHIDIIELDAASNRKIDDIRDLIEQTHYVPSIAPYKVFIIDEVHMLTKEAFNALLKTLEEPPDFVRFILATTDPLKLPQTILSRTQHFRFKKISHKDTIKHVAHILDKEGIEYEDAALDVIARSANGSLRDTLTILDQAIVYSKGIIELSSVVAMLGILDPQKTHELFRLILDEKKDEALEFVLGFEDFDAIALLDEMISYLKTALENKSIPVQILGKFFEILSQTKALLAIGTDAGFSFSLSILQMIEAVSASKTYPKDAIKAHIKQSNIASAQVASQTQELIMQAQPKQAPQKQASVADKSANPSPAQSEQERLWERFIDELYARDVDLAEVFRLNVSLCGFDGKKLSWHSKAKNQERAMLGKYYPAIKEVVASVFGAKVSIEAVKEAPKPRQAPIDPNPTPDPSPAPDLTPALDPSKQASAQPSQEPNSDIEDVFGSFSPSQKNTTKQEDATQEDKDAAEKMQILNDPFIKKAIEDFDANKVHVAKK